MATDDYRRGKVTEEHREEARKLRAVWDRELPRLKDAGVGTQEKFGQEFGIGNQAAVGFFLNGKTALSPKAAAGFARGLQCDVGEFSPRLKAVIGVPATAAADSASAFIREIVAAAELLTPAQRAALLQTAKAMAPGLRIPGEVASPHLREVIEAKAVADLDPGEPALLLRPPTPAAKSPAGGANRPPSGAAPAGSPKPRAKVRRGS